MVVSLVLRSSTELTDTVCQTSTTATSMMGVPSRRTSWRRSAPPWYRTTARAECSLDHADDGAVFLGVVEQVVHREHAAGAGHVSRDNRGIARDVAADELSDGAAKHVVSATGRAADNHVDRLTLIEIRDESALAGDAARHSSITALAVRRTAACMLSCLPGCTNRLAALARRVYKSNKRSIIKGRTIKR